MYQTWLLFCINMHFILKDKSAFGLNLQLSLSWEYRVKLGNDQTDKLS